MDYRYHKPCSLLVFVRTIKPYISITPGVSSLYIPDVNLADCLFHMMLLWPLQSFVSETLMGMRGQRLNLHIDLKLFIIITLLSITQLYTLLYTLIKLYEILKTI